MAFSFLILAVDLIPEALNWLISVINIFGTNFYLSVINYIFDVIETLIQVAKEIFFVFMAYKAL